MQVIMTLVFASALLIFMVYPAIRIVGFIESRVDISDRMFGVLTVLITIILSLIVAAGLYFI